MIAIEKLAANKATEKPLKNGYCFTKKKVGRYLWRNKLC